MVLVGIGLFVAGTMWLKGASFRPHARTAQVSFAEIGSLQRDNEVAVSGYTIGKVSAIEFKGPGRVLVTFTLPPDLALHADATAEIATSFFASGSRLTLNPGSDSAGPLPEGQPINGVTGSDLFAKGAKLADRADTVMIGLQAIANQKTANELTHTLQSLQRVLNTMNQRLPQTTTEAEKTMVSLPQAHRATRQHHRHDSRRQRRRARRHPGAQSLHHVDPAHRHRSATRQPAAEGQLGPGNASASSCRTAVSTSTAAPPSSRSRRSWMSSPNIPGS